jgi:hypothetical protein
MDADKNLNANFALVAGPVLTLTIGPRTEVTAASGELAYFCQGGAFGNTCEFGFGAENVVTLTIDTWPNATAGPLWLGPTCNEVDNYQDTCTFPMLGDQSVQLNADTGV